MLGRRSPSPASRTYRTELGSGIFRRFSQRGYWKSWVPSRSIDCSQGPFSVVAFVNPPHRPWRRLGQNFLRDREVASRIVDAAQLDSEDVVLEPGAGTGVLTRLIRTKAGRVIAVEKDPRLALGLRETFVNNGDVVVIEGDLLTSSLPPFNRVLGTPPYYLSSKLVLLLTRSKLETAHLVFQKEFGERLAAPPGSKDYGRLSVMTQKSFAVKPVFAIPRAAFVPKPKVDSILVELKPWPGSGSESGLFEETVRGLFNQRRRLVKSSLLHYLRLNLGEAKARTILPKMVLPEGRVFQLTVAQFEDLSDQLSVLLKDD